MTHPTFFMLYVKDAATSTRFYTQLLGQDPVETSENFALFILDTGVKLAVWSISEIEPKTVITGGGTELGFSFDTLPLLEKTYQDWKDLGLPIIQEPCEMDFGRTFTAIDPDGHRLRAYVLRMG